MQPSKLRTLLQIFIPWVFFTCTSRRAGRFLCKLWLCDAWLHSGHAFYMVICPKPNLSCYWTPALRSFCSLDWEFHLIYNVIRMSPASPTLSWCPLQYTSMSWALRSFILSAWEKKLPYERWTLTLWSLVIFTVICLDVFPMLDKILFLVLRRHALIHIRNPTVSLKSGKIET